MSEEPLIAGESIKEAIRGLGLKATKPRIAILKALRLSHTHVTAKEVYHLVYKENPDISLATVHRFLRVLSENSQALLINIQPTKKETAGLVVEPRWHRRMSFEEYLLQFKGVNKRQIERASKLDIVVVTRMLAHDPEVVVISRNVTSVFKEWVAAGCR